MLSVSLKLMSDERRTINVGSALICIMVMSYIPFSNFYRFIAGLTVYSIIIVFLMLFEFESPQRETQGKIV